MNIYQTRISLKACSRGFHIVTDEITDKLPNLKECKAGLLHLLLLHTSASLTLNENWDPSVRADFESHFNKFIPENASYYQHTYEGSDDMPAHLKSSTLGVSLTIPVQNGELVLGTWQGIYLGEHRDFASGRQVFATLQGEFT